MLLPRIIPTLLIQGERLVKTVQFRSPEYVGDPRNAVRIFNDREVDELLLVDIDATPRSSGPNVGLIEEVVAEAFMPIAYGGGITTVEQCEKVFAVGVEKVVVNSRAIVDPSFVTHAASRFGSQSVVAAIDAKMRRFGRYTTMGSSGTRDFKQDPAVVAKRLQDAGAGEVIVTAIDREGTAEGYDELLTRSVVEAVRVPVIANGGASSLQDMARVINSTGASAAAAGSLFVFYGRHRAVLINYPDRIEITKALAERT